jgi:phage tail protein X
MKKIPPLLLTLALSTGLAVPALAQNVGSFENFLNSHPNTAAELQANPNLINEPQWMGHHQGLEEYMVAHPDVRADMHANPGAFMNNGGHWSWNNSGFNNGNPAASNFRNGYLDEHPEVSQQLARNPGLADNPSYLSAHPGLQDYLNAHPNVQYDLEHHPDRFMNSADNGRGGYPGSIGGNPAASNFRNGYLDEHPEVSQQLARNPGLADNPSYLSAHPGLQNYLNAHPNVHYDLEHHPDRFMSQEDQFNGHPSGPNPESFNHVAPPPAAHGNWQTFAAEHPHAAAQYYKHHHH